MRYKVQVVRHFVILFQSSYSECNHISGLWEKICLSREKWPWENHFIENDGKVSSVWQAFKGVWELMMMIMIN